MTLTKVAVGDKKPLLIFAFSLPDNLFTNEALMVVCSLGKMNEIKTTSLLNIKATDIAFIDLAIVRHVCEVLQISFIQLAKPKPIKGFDSKPAPPITHAIYPMLIVQGKKLEKLKKIECDRNSTGYSRKVYGTNKTYPKTSNCSQAKNGASG